MTFVTGWKKTTKRDFKKLKTKYKKRKGRRHLAFKKRGTHKFCKYQEKLVLFVLVFKL